MFLPVGPDAKIGSNGGNPTSLSLSGIDRDNAVLRIAVTMPGHADILFTGPGFTAVSLSLFSGETFVHIPQGADNVTVTPFSAPAINTSVNTIVSITVGKFY